MVGRRRTRVTASTSTCFESGSVPPRGANLPTERGGPLWFEPEPAGNWNLSAAPLWAFAAGRSWPTSWGLLGPSPGTCGSRTSWRLRLASRTRPRRSCSIATLRGGTSKRKRQVHSASTWSGITGCRVEAEQPKTFQAYPLRSRKVEAIQVHHLVPGRHEVIDKLLLRVRASVDFS